MSVWSDPCYRSEPLIVVSEYLDRFAPLNSNILSLCDFEVDPHPNFSSNIPSGNFRENVIAGRVNIQNVAYKFGKSHYVPLQKRFDRLEDVKFGIDAVYTLFSEIFNGKLVLSNEYDQGECEYFCSRLMKSFGPSNYSSPKEWEELADSHFKNWDSSNRETPLFWLQQAEAFRHLLVASGLASYKSAKKKAEQAEKPLPALDKKTIFGNKSTFWRAYRHNSVTILEFARDRETTPLHIKPRYSFVLLNKDVTRLSQMLESTGKVLMYFSFYADRKNSLSLKLKHDALEVFDLLVSSFKPENKRRFNSICRSMDIAMYQYLAELAGPLARRSLDEQIRKGHDGHYNAAFPIDSMLAILRRYKIREGLELASIRKILPVPDFCIYSNQQKSYDMHMNPHEQIDSGIDGVNLDDFSRYWDWSMIRNYFDRHGYCPGYIKTGVDAKRWHRDYPEMEPRMIPYTEVGDIEWKATFVYQDYSFSEHMLRKDKTMAPRKLEVDATAASLKELPLWERNQIASLIMNPNMPSLTKLRESVVNSSEDFDYVHLVAMKPESKKEGGRNFYMANDAQRVLMSEKEANVADYLVHKAGNSSGISDIELAKSMTEIAALPLEAVRKVFVSFDLEKWSPKQNPKLKEMAYEKWSHAFGLKHIKPLLKVHQGSRLAFLKHNIHHEYRNPGQDLEGYDAKTNTALHIEVMSYAINVCRRLGKLKKGARLLSLIDDGGMSLEFEHTATDEEILDCIATIEKVYQMVGLRISWDKTFVSEKLFQYLNEVYFNGFKVTPGLKAFLRVGKPIDLPAKTILDDLDAVSGEIQGAMKAGASYAMSFGAYCFEVYRLLKRWSRYKVKLSDPQVLMCLTPVAFGGIGMRSMLQLATNEAFNPLAAGIGNLKAFATYYRGNAPLINDLIRSAMKEMTPQSFVRAPRAIRADVKVVNARRFENAMRDWIEVHAQNPFIRNVLASTAKGSNVEVLNRTKELSQISSIGLKALNDLRPDTAVDSVVNKLQRSQTAVDMLGFRQMVRIMVANRYQGAQLIEGFGKDISMSRLRFAH